MKCHILTLFPEMIEQALGTSIIGKAQDKQIIQMNYVNIRDFANNKNKKVDDYPYGGGAGMLMQAEPVYNAFKSLKFESGKNPRVVYLTPQGKVFNQQIAQEFSNEEELVLLCGHYEGIDERALELIVTDYISIGDYVLTGGELAAMVVVDAVSRLVPGVLHNDSSSEFESFQDGLLEYPHYTRPVEFMGKMVPEVLLSGHHSNIEKWRREKSIKRTLERRPDLLSKAELTPKERSELQK